MQSKQSADMWERENAFIFGLRLRQRRPKRLPLLRFDRSIYGGYHVFGHTHNNKNDVAFLLQKQLSNSFNCGADVIDFVPRTLDELISLKKEVWYER